MKSGGKRRYKRVSDRQSSDCAAVKLHRSPNSPSTYGDRKPRLKGDRITSQATTAISSVKSLPKGDHRFPIQPKAIAGLPLTQG
jgi:hypothetical protein